MESFSLWVRGGWACRNDVGWGMGPRIREDKRGGAVYVCHGRDGRWVGDGSPHSEDKRGGAVYVWGEMGVG